MLRNIVLVGILSLAVADQTPAAAREVFGSSRHANRRVRVEPRYSPIAPEVLKDGIVRSVASDTTYLGTWSFDSASGCSMQEWMPVDVTAQTGCYFHVDDFASLGGGSYGALTPLEGQQSLWCGARPDAGDSTLCGYAELPGYGNSWDQSWVFKCIDVAKNRSIYVDYLASWDTEEDYDVATLEYASSAVSCADVDTLESLLQSDWTEVANFSGTGGPALQNSVIAAQVHEQYVKIRFHFRSDGAWSDQDGFLDSDGAFLVDSLRVSNSIGTVFDVEDFEDESVGDTQTLDGDWGCWGQPGFGDFAGLFPGVGVVQEGFPAQRNASCLWGFFSGSTETYACGGFPGQLAVPKENAFAQYVDNEIWSPKMPFVGSGSGVGLSFDVYRDLPADNGVYYSWAVRSWVDGCPGEWQNRDLVYGGDDKEWLHSVQDIGALIEPGATHIQVLLGVIDLVGQGYGSGLCHSHAPLFDNVSVYRYDTVGPAWSVRDIDLFQDTFPSGGAGSGAGRADAAIDVNPYSNPVILPGDSVAVRCSDPEHGLGTDPSFGGAAVYCSVALRPQGQPGKSLTTIEGIDPANGGHRWPFVGATVGVNGLSWFNYRMDQCFLQPGRDQPVADKYCFDLNDNVFTSGDTINFYFYAENAIGQRTYWSEFTGTVTNRALVEANPMEFQILPGGGYARGGDILYVDDCDEEGHQQYFDQAFDMMGISDLVDRYDVRGASSGVSNSPGGRVGNVVNQIIPFYRKILWNTGDLGAATIGDGATNEKADDFWVLYDFLEWHTDPDGGAVYVSGDDVAEEWATLGGLAPAFNATFIPHTLVSGDHRQAFQFMGSYWGSLLVEGMPGGIFDHPSGVDSLYASGFYPSSSDFDVITPTGSSVLEMQYNAFDQTGGAVISNTSVSPQASPAGNPTKVVLSGFGFGAVHDIEPTGTGVPERVHHLRDILLFLDNTPPEPVGAGPQRLRNSLAQNYPNPFNPSTTIEYSIAEPGPVTLKVYNVAGQLVRTLVDERRAGARASYTATWDGRGDNGVPVASGVYFYRIVAKNFSQTRKMVLLK